MMNPRVRNLKTTSDVLNMLEDLELDLSEKIVNAREERIRKERQRERDLRHSQRMVQENREMNHHGGVHHSPAINGGHHREHFSGTGSEGSDDSLHIGSGTHRKYVSHTKTTKHRIVRRSDSEDEASKDGSTERLQMPPATTFNNSDNVIRSKGVVFLQCADDVKRVNLPATVTSIDTLKALFVNSFPDRITMQDFEDNLKSVYIKDADSGTYYMLEDVGEVLNRSFLKIHTKAPSIQSSQILLTSNEHVEAEPVQKTPAIDYPTPAYNVTPNRPAVNGSSHVTTKTTTTRVETHDHTNGSSVPRESTHVHVKGVYSQPNTPKRNVSYKQQDTPAPQSDAQPYSSHSSTTVNEVLRTSVKKSRNDSYSSAPQKNETVENQLDDLTELLKTALDEEEQHHAEIMECVNTKNPGKLDPSLIKNIQRQSEESARKSTLPKYFQPTIMVAAQQESDRRTSERSNSESDSSGVGTTRKSTSGNTKTVNNIVVDDVDKAIEVINGIEVPPPSSSVKTRDEVVVSEKIRTDNSNDRNRIIDRSDEVDTSIVSPTHKRITINKTVEVRDTVDGTTSTAVLPEQHVDSQLDIGTASNVNKPKSGDMSAAELSEVLMDQIMDMELEVKARSNLNMRNSQRSSTGSSCSKSSIPNSVDKLNLSSEDQHSKVETATLAQPVVDQTHYTSMHDTSLNNSTKIEDNSVNEMYSSVNKPRADTTDEVFDDNGPNMQHIYASISKVTELPTSSKVITTFSNTTKSNVKRSSTRKSTGETAIHHASVTTPDFVELEDSAKSVHVSLQELRKDLSNLRKTHVDGVRTFKADMQKKLLEFRKKAARVDEVLQQKLDVNNNIVFANEHPVRERRHRLTQDQISYNTKMSDTEVRLKFLEGDMEMVRISVVNKKRVENPQHLKDLHEELTQLTKGLAEIKNRFHGLHDMLKIVMPDEMKIISTEEKFLKDEPQKLEGLISRCKVLSGTLFTLERLASVQLEHGDAIQQQQQHHMSHHQQQSQSQQSHHQTTRTASYTKQSTKSFSQPVANNEVFNIEDLKGKRNVRFSHKN